MRLTASLFRLLRKNFATFRTEVKRIRPHLCTRKISERSKIVKCDYEEPDARRNPLTNSMNMNPSETTFRLARPENREKILSRPVQKVCSKKLCRSP